MTNVITLFGREIPLYGLFFYLGILLAAVVALLICKKGGLSKWEIVYSGIYSMIGALIGSKLLFILVSLKTIIEMKLSFEAIIKGGFVFYGGLLGGVLGLLIYVKQYKMKFSDFADIYSVCLTLGHAIGRVGCFFAGCCYGIPYKYGYTYTDTHGITPLGVPLLPIQLIESACLLALFFVLLTVYLRKNPKKGTCTGIYILSYSVVRFVLEFFRGDVERGNLWLFSTSQWISILMFLLLLYFFSLSVKI